MSEPVRLAKVEEEDTMKLTSLILDKIEAWVLSHAFLCLFILMALLIAMLVCLIFVLTGVSATESGVVYNQFDKLV